MVPFGTKLFSIALQITHFWHLENRKMVTKSWKLFSPILFDMEICTYLPNMGLLS
jgi:hypothetical protein